MNTQYLGKCTQFYFDTSKIKLGQSLGVNSRYFREAISTIHELSIKLTQFIWRKLIPSERDDADVSLNDVTFELIKGDDFGLAERLLDYGLHHTGKGEDRSRRVMAINYANAIKLGGDKKRAEAELAKYDWTATSINFKIAVAAVRDNLAEVVGMMKSAVRSEELTESDFRDWPVFKTMRGEKTFQDEFKSIFNKDLISSASLSSSSETAIPKISQKPQQELQRAKRQPAKGPIITKH